MSVVNQMLKDLDKRQQQHTFNGVNAAQISSGSDRSGWKLLLGGLLLGVLIVVAGWWLLNKAELHTGSVSESVAQHQLVTLPQNQQQAATASVDPVVKADVAAVKPATPPNSVTKLEQFDTAATQANSAEKTPARTAAIEQTQAPTVKVQGAESQRKAPQMAASTTAATTATASPVAQTQTAQASPPAAKATKPKLQITEVALTPAELAQKQLKQATNALEREDNREAVMLLRQALQNDASLHEARRQLAAVYYRNGSLADAEAVLQRGVNRFPEQQEFWLLLARVQIASKQWQAADNSLNQLHDNGALAAEKWLAKIQVAQQGQQWPVVQQGYEQLIQLAPSNSRWHFGLAHALDVQQQYAAAVSEYQQAMQLSGLSADARAYIQQRLAQIGDLR